MQGRRIYPDVDGQLSFRPGDYGKKGDVWLACTPNGLLGNLNSHEVIENADGSITVRPSILVEHDDGKSYHGYLTSGFWQED